jgi:SAM-dependent methyltransferase
MSARPLGDEEVKRGVKEWYDRFGWRRNDRGQYNDSALFSQTRPIGHGLYELSSHLSVLDRLPGGDFVLDAASGAIAHPEYLAFSWFYKSRVCVDMSITALSEADAKLRRRDFCCLADICSLPFRDETFDAAVSGYTIQHIPEAQQVRAITELYRVLRPNAHLCIFTNVVPSRGHEDVVFLLRGLRKGLKMLRLIRPMAARPTSDAPAPLPPHALYSFARTVKWWEDVASDLAAQHSIEALRLLNKTEFEQLFGRSNRAAKVLRFVEGALPQWTAGLSAYCLVDICKSPAGSKT